MTTTESETTTPSEYLTCGCCGQARPAGRVHELGATPGVYICNRCAFWAAGQLSKFPVVQLDPRRLLRRLNSRRHGHGHAEEVLGAIPILASADLDSTCAFYESLGFSTVERSDGYLVTHSGGTELHFASGPDIQPVPQTVFLRVGDAGARWKQLRAEAVAGLGPVRDEPWGVREFVATDPDGNRIRFGSHIPEG